MGDMPQRKSLRSRHQQALESLRLHLSRPDALLQLSVLGVVTGLAAGGVILAFRWSIETLQSGFLPGNLPDNFEALPLWWRVLLPLLGGLGVGLLFHWLARGYYVVGVVQVLERLAYHQGRLHFRGMLLQFIGGILTIVTGQSVGREGPSIHLGAATGSLLGQRLGLPNNTLRTLVACGTAAAIGASFNTPLAGVIFALEVVMMEYTVASFLPVLLAAVSATSLTVAVYGSAPAFMVSPPQLTSLWELPFIIFFGMVVGMLATAFNQLSARLAESTRKRAFWMRTTAAGGITGLCALAFPEVMGIGYDTVNATLLGELALGTMIGVTLAKLVATAGAVGLGLPGGLIGPTLVMGTTLGGTMGILAHEFFPEHSADAGFYALLGLGAMMGATLQAPLAALTAMMELSGSPMIILPGMLAIVSAVLTSSELFRQSSIFLHLLRARGLDYRSTPIMQTLRRIGVASAMDRRVERMDNLISREEAEHCLRREPEWLLVNGREGPAALLPAVDLARVVQEDTESSEFDLLEIPGHRLQVAAIDLQASLLEAHELLQRTQAEALYVERVTAPGIRKLYGILTRERIDSAYRF